MVISNEQRGCLVALEEIKVPNYKVSLLIMMLLLTHGNIKSNQGPKIRISNYFSCCYWIVNSIMTYKKLPLISAHNTVTKYDIIYIPESYLHNTAANNVLSIDGYNLIRDDHPNNQKKGGVCTLKNN